MSLVIVERIDFSIGSRRLLNQTSFTIDAGERVCLIGRNGEGKSTLLKILAGQVQAEDGRVHWANGQQATMVAQAPSFDAQGTVFEAVAAGLGDLSALITEYHALSQRLADSPTDGEMKRLDVVQQQLDTRDGWLLEQRVEQVMSRLHLPAEQLVGQLSGGWQRRVALAQALVRQPDLLLLDEPTNHLDIEAIEWLENFLLGYPGGLLFVTHDRSLLQKLATRILELDRGEVTSWPGDYENYLRRVEERQNAEDKQRAEFDKKLAREEVWIRQGIQARRTRNEGRVRALQALRVERGARIERVGTATLELSGGERSGRLVLEAKNISKAFADLTVVDDFSLRLMRGDRVGLLGPNGAGKTTLLRLLLGDLEPDSGTVHLGTSLEIAYFDQHRAGLDDSLSALDNVAGGSDSVTVNGQSVHVITYLQRFLFAPDRARTKVSALSGGERNRLMLARLFTRPINLLVLDEPTNDLDLETLEVLEELLFEFKGTLLLVSHDRAFIDNVVTSTLAFEGNGKVRGYVGGYEQWLKQRRAEPKVAAKVAEPARKKPAAKASLKKLAYKDQRELAELPKRIERLEAELDELQAVTTTDGFYQGNADAIKDVLARLAALGDQITLAYQRWEELEQD